MQDINKINRLGVMLLEEYYKKHRSRLKSKLTRRCTNSQDAEDVLHNAFVKALGSIGKFDTDRKIGNWFTSIVNNCHRDYIKVEVRRGMTFEGFNEDEHWTDDPEDFRLDVNRVKKAINKKGGSVREILKLYFLEDYQPSDIAPLIGDGMIANKTIRNHVHTFKKEMREKYCE